MLLSPSPTLHKYSSHSLFTSSHFPHPLLSRSQIMKTITTFLIAFLLAASLSTLSSATRPEPAGTTQSQPKPSKEKGQKQNQNNNKGSSSSGGGSNGGPGGFFSPGGGFNVPGFGSGWGSPGMGGGYGAGYGGPSGGYSKGGTIRPTVVCKEKGPCYKKKLTCPAKCFTSYSRSGKNYGSGGGGGGCTMDCQKKCVAYC